MLLLISLWTSLIFPYYYWTNPWGLNYFAEKKNFSPLISLITYTLIFLMVKPLMMWNSRRNIKNISLEDNWTFRNLSIKWVKSNLFVDRFSCITREHRVHMNSGCFISINHCQTKCVRSENKLRNEVHLQWFDIDLDKRDLFLFNRLFSFYTTHHIRFSWTI